MDRAEQDTRKGTRPLLFSVVVPAYNEEAVVEATLSRLSEHLDREGFDYEILVVDDASTDATAKVVQAIASQRPRIRYLHNPGPNGYGFAIRKGLDQYRGDAVVIVTADGSDAPKDVAAYFRKIEEGYDCAFGSRFVPGATVSGYPVAKLWMNRLTNRSMARLLGEPYTDFTNGFKCYRRHVIDAMQPLVAGQFNITVELAVKAILGGFRYAVVPTDWTQRDAGASSFKVLRLMKPYGTTFLYCLTEDYLKRVRR
jgi:dolichol-phosphate mannosyltransferase